MMVLKSLPSAQAKHLYNYTHGGVFIMASKGQKYREYDLEFKNKVLQEHKKGQSASYLAKKYDIPKNTIFTWARIERIQGALGIKKLGRPKGTKTKDYKERYEILKKFQDFLVKQEQKKK
jgi:transposase-like protein